VLLYVAPRRHVLNAASHAVRMKGKRMHAYVYIRTHTCVCVYIQYVYIWFFILLYFDDLSHCLFLPVFKCVAFL